MNQWQQFIRNWTRPSIQQPRRIRQAVDKLFSPMIQCQQVIKEFWDTWNTVYKPERKKDDNNQRKES